MANALRAIGSRSTTATKRREEVLTARSLLGVVSRTVQIVELEAVLEGLCAAPFLPCPQPDAGPDKNVESGHSAPGAPRTPSTKGIRELEAVPDGQGTARPIPCPLTDAGTGGIAESGPPEPAAPRTPPARLGWSVMEVEVNSLTADPAIQPREELSLDIIAQYAEDMRDGDAFPAVTVFENPDSGERVLADGFHRFLAAKQAGVLTLRAEIHQGTRGDARWHAVGANRAHGLRRSNADKRKAVRLALEMHPEYSDEKIGGHVGVHRQTVLAMRHEVVEDRQAGVRVGIDGKRYPPQQVPRTEGDLAEAPPAPPAPGQSVTMDGIDAPADTPDLEGGNTAAAVLPEVEDQGQPSVDVEIEPAVEQVLRIVADTLGNAAPGAVPLDCLARIAETLRLAYPAFCRRVQHLLAVPASR